MFRVISYIGIYLFAIMMLTSGMQTLFAADIPMNLFPLEKHFYNNDFDCILPDGELRQELPFTRVGNLIVLQAKVDSMEGNFILDTGAPGLILNFTYFRDYRATRGSEADAGGITGEVSQTSAIEVSILKMGLFEFYRISTQRINLGHIENSKGIKILGLLGSGLFKNFDMILDYENDMIILHRHPKSRISKRFNIFETNESGLRVIPLNIKDGKIFTEMKYGNKTLNFLLDTGAESNVLDARLPKSVTNQVILNRKVTLIGSGKKSLDAWYGQLGGLISGTHSIVEMEYLMTSLENMSTSYERKIDGMLGYPFLSRQKVGISFVENKLYLFP